MGREEGLGKEHSVQSLCLHKKEEKDVKKLQGSKARSDFTSPFSLAPA